MGTLTYVDLRAELKAALANRSDIVDARYGRALNLAQSRLARIHDFYEMEVISEGLLQNTGSDTDRFLTLPLLREMYSAVLIDGANSRKLTHVAHRRIETYIPKPEYWARDWPVQYAVWGFNMEVYPLPRANFKLRVRWTQWPAPLVNDIDISRFLNKDDVLIELGQSYLYRSLGKEDDAAKHEKFAMTLLEEGEETDRTHPDLDIRPGLSSSQIVTNSPATPWPNPFSKGTP